MIRTLPIALLVLCLLSGCAAQRRAVVEPSWEDFEQTLRARARARSQPARDLTAASRGETGSDDEVEAPPGPEPQALTEETPVVVAREEKPLLRDAWDDGSGEGVRSPPEDEPRTSKRDPWVDVTVFYGTDRIPTGDRRNRGYGPRPRCPLEFDGGLPYPAGEPSCFERGSAVVTIPTAHERGHVEGISVLRLEFRRDPRRHVLLESVTPLETEAWTRRLVRRVRSSSERQLMVFVHGYNTTFDQALLRTAQIAHDLPFDGPAVAWSWASSGRVVDYWADEDRVEASAPHLRLFLEQLARDAGADAIHLVAHSMGSRALTDALVELAWDGPEPPFDQVVLAAPDIDAGPFAEQMAPRLRAVAGRVTLYASDHDRALHAAKLVHRAERAGSAAGAPDSGEIDTVDATEVDTALLGHGYIGSSPPVLVDLLQLFEGIAPDLRCWLERDGRRWRFAEACRDE